MANTTVPGEEVLSPQVKGVSVVIPCMNEENAVGLTVAEIDRALADQPYDYEIIVVDDGSSDHTRERAKDAGARVVVHNKNQGYGNSIMDGVSVAKYSVIAITDGDGTYPNHLLPELIEMTNRYDMVVGARTFNDENTAWLNLIMRRVLFYLTRYLTSVSAKDLNSGLRVFHKADLLDYRHILCPTFSFTTTMTLLWLLLARNVCYVDIPYSKRIGTSKVRVIKDAFKTLSYVLMIANLFQIYRLAFFVILSLFAASAGVAVLAWLTGMSTGVHVAVQLTMTGAFVIGFMAMVGLPTTKLYKFSLHQATR